ncbi:Hypothetical protein YozC [Bacillus subtilis subsp. subtilis str. BSP1]|nr:Hypothetical protein YozC [Bacillus subtilis subsp. subtilis str. BSP1]
MIFLILFYISCFNHKKTAAELRIMYRCFNKICLMLQGSITSLRSILYNSRRLYSYCRPQRETPLFHFLLHILFPALKRGLRYIFFAFVCTHFTFLIVSFSSQFL